MPNTESINDQIVEDGQISTFPTDGNGNIIANVNVRSGTLAGLSVVVGGDGEIAVVTDLPALTRFDATGQAHYIGGAGPVNRVLAYGGIAATVPTGASLVTLPIDTASLDIMSSLNTTDYEITGVVCPDNNTSILDEITAKVSFAASAVGTTRKVVIQREINNSGSWATIGTSDYAVMVSASKPTEVVVSTSLSNGTAGDILKYRVRAAQDSTANMEVTVSSIEVKSTVVTV